MFGNEVGDEISGHYVSPLVKADSVLVVALDLKQIKTSCWGFSVVTRMP